MNQAIRVVLALAVSATAGAQPVDQLPVTPDSTTDGAVIGFTLGALPWATLTALDWHEGRPSGVEAFGQLALMLGSGTAGALIGASLDRARISVHDPVWDGALKGALAGTASYLVQYRLARRYDRSWPTPSEELAVGLITTGGAGALVGALVDARFTAAVRPLPGGAALSVAW